MLLHRKNRKTTATRNAYKIAGPAIVASLLMLPGSSAVATDREPQGSSLHSLCGLWDGQASAALVRTASESQDKLDLQRLSDDLFRMRRARRSCDLGLIQAACQDYIAITRGVGGTLLKWRGSTQVCPPALTNESYPNMRQTETLRD
jgi:hypothetical protein